MAQARRPQDRQDKEPTKQQIVLRAQELDDRRQQQIANQVKIINRLMEVNQAYEGALEEIADHDGNLLGVRSLARNALAKAADINRKHRKEDSNG